MAQWLQHLATLGHPSPPLASSGMSHNSIQGYIGTSLPPPLAGSGMSHNSL
ncbi:hypothetical protein M404DRAFT_23304 [Pisolithus tinctorius Marx 270]|uniref:Uncharacterized protein n=1 Tax=Pisolithus tinctorius Marx 270 TaxID=870435 RepID=A0A0C3KEM3_PISTI|nr:hypothetical protein M404DRAFT_23304 [Pisolithus tinctorius Marx 270]